MPVAAKPDRHCLFDVLGNAEIACEKVRGSRRNDGESDIGARQHVNTSLNHSVTTPRKNELSAPVHRTLNLSRRLPALRNLAPERVVDPFRGESPAKLGEATSKCLA